MNENGKDIQVYFGNIGNEEVSVQVSEISSTPYHRHTFLEIAYVAEGSAQHYFNDMSVTVKKGDYYAIDFGEVHKYSPNGDGSFKVINCLFRPEFIDASLKNCRGFSDLIANYLIKFEYESLRSVPTRVIYKDENLSVSHLFDKMLCEYNERQPRFQEVIRCHIIELIIITLRKIYEESALGKANRPINKVISYINKNYMKSITLSQISSDMGYSLPYISSSFGKTVSMPFSKFLQKVRIEKACHMLANTHANVDNVASLVGYSDVKYFRVVFRRIVGKSPSEYRSMYHTNPSLKAD